MAMCSRIIITDDQHEEIYIHLDGELIYTANQNPTPNARSDSSSRYKGVGRYRGGWRAQGWKDGRTVWIGKFDTEPKAVAAYDEWRSQQCQASS